MSRVTTVVGKEEEAKVAEWWESFLYPLFAEVAAKTRPHPLVTFLQFLITFLQIFTCFFFISSDFVWNKKNMPFAVKVISYVVNLGVINDVEFSKSYPQYIVIFTYFVLELLMFLSIFIWYRSTRSFIRWQLNLFRFFLSTNLVFVVIGANLTGYSVTETAREPSLDSVFVLISTMLITIILAVANYFANYLLCYSPYLPRSFTATWPGISTNMLYLYLIIAAFLGPCLNVLPAWLFLFNLCCGIVFCAYEMYYLSFLPCVKRQMNAIFFGLLSAQLISTILTFVRYYIDIDEELLYFDFAIVVVLAMLIFYFGYIIPQEKRVLRHLTPNLERMTPEEMSQYFDKIQFSSHRAAIMYLHVGVSKLSPSVTDFTFMRYMVDNYKQTDILFSILQITSFFPCEQQFLSYLLSVVKQIPTISFGQNFMIYQIQKIRIIRQSSVSLEASSALDILRKMAMDTISQVRGFWSEIQHSKSDISIASLYYLRNISVRTNTAFMDAIDKYPNSQGLNDAYCTFLIEAMGDFSKAVHISHRLSMIEQGKQFVTDLAFLNFVNVFPQYLTKNVLTVHGNRAMTEMSSMDSSAERSSIDWSNDNIDMDLLGKKCEDIIVGMIDHGKLRLALQHAMKFFTPTPLKFIIFLTVLQFVSYFVLAIVVLVIVPTVSSKPLVMMKSFTNTNNYITSYLYMADICCGFQVQEVSDMFLRGDCLDHISKMLNISIKKLKSKPSIFNEPAVSLHQSILDFQDEFSSEITLSLQNMDLHKNLMKYLTNDSAAEMIQYDPLSFVTAQVIYMPLKSRFTSQAGLLDYISSYLEMNNYDSQIILSMGSIMRDIFTSGPLINQIFDLLSPPSMEVCDENEQWLRKIAITTISVFGAFFIITELITYFFVSRSNLKLSNLLRSVKTEVVQSSSKPISRKGKRKDLSTGSRHSPHDFSFIMASMPAIFIISIAVVTVLILMACLNYADSIKFIKQLFICSFHASLRAANVQSIFLNIALNKTGMAGDFDVNENTIDNYLEQILNTTSTLNLELIGQNSFFDKYYFSDNNEDLLGENIDFADFIDGISISNRLNLAYMYLQKVFILHKIRISEHITKDYNFLFENEFTNFLFLLDMYVAELLRDLQLNLYDFTEKRFNTMFDFVLLMSVFTIVVSLIILLIYTFFIRSLKMSYESFKQLVLLIDPVEAMKNKSLLELITGYSIDESISIMKPSELILTSMESGILIIDRDLVIQNVNDSVQQLTGFTPDQLLGQSVTFLVPIPMDEIQHSKIDMSLMNSFYPVIHDILEGIGDPSTVVDTDVMTESSSLLKTQMTIIPTIVKNSVDKITLLFHGVQEKIVQVQKLKILQQRIDVILKSIIPKCLFDDPNFGERSTVFRAKQATIVFIEICGLSDFVFTMSPKQLMSAMEMVYTSIDDAAKKYETVHAIKRSDDSYIAALGLFDNVGQIERQVNDAVCFADEVLLHLEEVNDQLGVDITLGIGIHTGGPVVGYIEDPSNLRIEVLSEVLRSSMKMQEIGERNVIQITKSAADYIINPKFKMFPVHQVRTGDIEEQVYYLRESQLKDHQTVPTE